MTATITLVFKITRGLFSLLRSHCRDAGLAHVRPWNGETTSMLDRDPCDRRPPDSRTVGPYNMTAAPYNMCTPGWKREEHAQGYRYKGK